VDKELTMFEMLKADSAQPQDRKMMMVRIGALTVAVLILGGIVYLFAFLPYAHR
jgi:hypothetical protein